MTGIRVIDVIGEDACDPNQGRHAGDIAVRGRTRADGGESAWTWRLLVLVTILLMTLQLASHALARAGVIERERAQYSASRVSGG